MATTYKSGITLLDSIARPTQLQEGDVLWFDSTDSTIHITRGATNLRLLWNNDAGISRTTDFFSAGGGGPCGLEFMIMLIAGCAGFALESTTLLSRRESAFRVIRRPT